MKLIIDAREIEQALARHPMVAAAAVIGTADDATGRQAKALVVLEEMAQLSSSSPGYPVVSCQTRSSSERLSPK